MKTQRVLLLILLFAGGLAAQDTTHFINRFKFSNEKEWTEKRRAYYLNSEEIYSTDLEGYYRKGIRNLQLEFYDSAIVDFKRSIDMASYETHDWHTSTTGMDYHPNYLMGVCFRLLDLNDSAVFYLKKSIEDDPLFEDAYFELAKTYALKGDYEIGLSYCDEMLRINEFSGDAYYLKALIYYDQDNEKQCFKELKKATKTDPKNVYAHLFLAELYLNRARNDMVIKECSRAIEIDSSIAFAYLYRGMAQKNKRQYALALADFNKGYLLDSTDNSFNYYRGWVSLKMKNNNNAIEYFVANIKNEQKNENKYYADDWNDLELKDIIATMHKQALSQDEMKVGLVFLHIMFGMGTADDVVLITRYAKKIPGSLFISRIQNFMLYIQLGPTLYPSRTESLISEDSSLIFLMMLSAELNQFNNDDQGSIALYNKVITSIPNYTNAYYMRGLCFKKTEQFDKAFRDMEKVLELDPDDYSAQYTLGEILYDMKFYRQAINSYMALQKKLKPMALMDCALAKCYLGMEQLDSADRYYESAMKISPKYVPALHGQGKVLFQQKKYKESIVKYNLAMRNGGRDGELLLDRGKAKFAIKDYTEALFDFREAISLDPGLSEAYRVAGQASFLLGKYSQCIDFNTQVVQHDPQDFAARYQIALSHLLLGHVDESRQYYITAAQANLKYNDSIEPEAIYDLEGFVNSYKLKKPAQEIMNELLEMKSEKSKMLPETHSQK